MPKKLFVHYHFQKAGHLTLMPSGQVRFEYSPEWQTHADAHGKNPSLLCENQRRLRLAPFYDLVCTRNYRNISRHMAMNLGGVSDPDQIGTQQLQAMAEDLGVRPNVVIKTAATLSEKFCEAIPETVSKFADMFGSSPVLERIPIIIRKQICRLKSMLQKS